MIPLLMHTRGQIKPFKTLAAGKPLDIYCILHKCMVLFSLFFFNGNTGSSKALKINLKQRISFEQINVTFYNLERDVRICYVWNYIYSIFGPQFVRKGFL